MKRETISRLEGLYGGSITVPVVNSLQGRENHDVRNALRQGRVRSMDWFAVGIDPLLVFLDKQLKGIPVISLPVSGPALEHHRSLLPPLTDSFKLIAYCDDVKPAITSIEEFVTADVGASLFEKSAGTRLHRDPSTNKCKFLPLGKWRHSLSQEHIPTQYMRITDTLYMVGVELCSAWSRTRKRMV